MSVPKLNPVEVEWVDTAASGGWKSEAEQVASAKPTECRTAGYLLHRGKGHIVVAQNFNSRQPDGNEDLWADTIAIPVANVRKIRRLK